MSEYYHSGRDTGKQRTPSEYADSCIELMNNLYEQYETNIFYVFLDPSAQGLQEEIKRKSKGQPYTVHIRNAENDVKLGISRVQKTLTHNVLTVAPAQENLIHECGLYEYDKKSIEKGNEVPIKINDHCMDALRYLVMGAWKWIKRWLPDERKEDDE